MKYFTIKELSRTSHAGDNTPPAFVQENLERLVEKVLDPAREKFGAPITVNSGYRNPVLNREVGGAINSQHIKGEASDITTSSKEGNKRLFEIIKSIGDFDQLVNEHDLKWIHVSYKAQGNRKQILKIG